MAATATLSPMMTFNRLRQKPRGSLRVGGPGVDIRSGGGFMQRREGGTLMEERPMATPMATSRNEGSGGVLSSAQLQPGERSVVADPNVISARNPNAGRPFQRGVISGAGPQDAVRPGAIASLGREFQTMNQDAMRLSKDAQSNWNASRAQEFGYKPSEKSKIDSARQTQMGREFQRGVMGDRLQSAQAIAETQARGQADVADIAGIHGENIARAGSGAPSFATVQIPQRDPEGNLIRDNNGKVQMQDTIVDQKQVTAQTKPQGGQPSEADIYNSMSEEDQSRIDAIDKDLSGEGLNPFNIKNDPSGPKYKRLMRERGRIMAQYAPTPSASPMTPPAAPPTAQSARGAMRQPAQGQAPVQMSQVEAIAGAEAEYKKAGKVMPESVRKQILDSYK